MSFDLMTESLSQGMFVAGSLFFLGKVGRARPTGRTLALAFAPALFLLLAFWQANLANGVVFYFPGLLLVLGLDRFRLSASASHIELSRSIKAKWAIGQRNKISITIRNLNNTLLEGWIDGEIPSGLQGGEERIRLPVSVPPFGQQEVSYFLRAQRRGPYHFGPVRLQYVSALGLLSIMAEGRTDDFIHVLPDWRREKRLRLMAGRSGQAGESYKRRRGVEGDRFSNLRHYIAGDELRKMAWQATARLDTPVVRMFEPAVEQPLLVLLDAGQRMASVSQDLQKYDWALNTAMALIGVALERSDEVGVGVFCNRILAETPIRSGKGQRQRILETLAGAEVQSVESDYERILPYFARTLKQSTLIVLMTDLADPIATGSLIRALRHVPPRHPMIVVTVSDSALEEIATPWPESSQDAYRLAIARDLLHWRQKNMRTLRQGIRGRPITVVDTPPEKLDEALLQHYLRQQRTAARYP